MATAQLSTLLRHIQKLAVSHGTQPGTDRQLLDDFVARRDDAVFALLVARHGPMVLRVCRRVLHHEQDAEDAFQATFLVLARNANSIRKREAVADWLHGVAYRTAMKAKRNAARRRNHEAHLRTLPVKTAASQTWDEVQAVLDQEIQRLPESFRSAFVLCVLEGKSGPEAAAELGIKEGTLSSRLTRARQRLQRQLGRRGIQLGVLLAALSVAEGASEAGVPTTLTHATIRSGILAAAGEATGEAIPAPIAALAAGVTRAMFLTKAKIALAVLFAVSLFAAGAGVLSQGATAIAESDPPRPLQQNAHAKDTEPQSPQKEAKDHRAAGKEEKTVAVSGRVLDPDDKPVAGAELTLVGRDTSGQAPQRITEAGGRFAFDLPPPPLGYEPRYILANAPGFGVGWVEVRGEPLTDATVRLTADLPVRGKVIDLQGKPVAGAKVEVHDIHTGPPGAFDQMVKKWKESGDEQEQAARKLDRSLWNRGSLGKAFHTSTAADGTFTLTGFGKDRVITLFITAPGIAHTYAAVATRTGFDPSGAPRTPLRLYPPDFTLAVSPDKPIAGTVRDAVTKVPLAGVRVCGTSASENTPFGTYLFHAWPEAVTNTDVNGRFTLRGLAKAKVYSLVADPAEGLPHLHRFVSVPDTIGFAAAETTLDLHRGIILTGRITDVTSGAGVQSRVFYRPLQNNELLERFPGYSYEADGFPAPWHRGRDTITGADGRYTLTIMPGAGVVHVQTVTSRRGTSDSADYLRARATKQDVADGIVDQQHGFFLTAGEGGMYNPEFLNAFKVIRPAATERTATMDLTVRLGASRRMKVVDTEGKPVTGASAVSVRSPGSLTRPPTAAEFTACGLDPDHPRRVLFFHADRKLCGTVSLDGKTTDPVTVKLEPLGTITGQLVNKDGSPAAGMRVRFYVQDEDVRDFSELRRNDEAVILTDTDGKFHLADVPHGLKLAVIATKPQDGVQTHRKEAVTLKPGEVLNLGRLEPK